MWLHFIDWFPINRICAFYTLHIHASKVLHCRLHILHSMIFSNLTKVLSNYPNATMSPLHLGTQNSDLKSSLFFLQGDWWGSIGASSFCCCDMYNFGSCRSSTFSCSCNSIQSKHPVLMNGSYSLRHPFLCLTDVLGFGSGWTVLKVENLSYPAKGTPSPLEEYCIHFALFLVALFI